jgi:hypothetical protein
VLNIAPRKPNWDLKRDVTKKVDEHIHLRLYVYIYMCVYVSTCQTHNVHIIPLVYIDGQTQSKNTAGHRRADQRKNPKRGSS